MSFDGEDVAMVDFQGRLEQFSDDDIEWGMGVREILLQDIEWGMGVDETWRRMSRTSKIAEQPLFLRWCL